MNTTDVKIKPSMRIGRLMFKYLRSDMTPKQKKELAAWRDVSAENEKCFKNAIDPDKIFRDLKAILETEDLLWEKLQHKLPHLRQLQD